MLLTLHSPRAAVCSQRAPCLSSIGSRAPTLHRPLPIPRSTQDRRVTELIRLYVMVGEPVPTKHSILSCLRIPEPGVIVQPKEVQTCLTEMSITLLESILERISMFTSMETW